MVSESVLTSYLGLAALSLLLTLCACFVTFKTTVQVYYKVFPPLERPRLGHSGSNQSGSGHSNQSVIIRKRKARTSLIFVEASCVLFTLCLIANFAYYLVVYSRLRDKNKPKLSDRRSWPMALLLIYISDGLLFSGYFCLSLAYFGRYQSTMNDTKYSFDTQTSKLFYTIAVTGYICGILASILFNLGYIMVGLIFLIPCFICYPSVTIGLVWYFFKATRLIALQNGQNIDNVDMDDSLRQRMDKLFQASLRLTIASSVALISSIVLILSTLIAAVWDDRPISVIIHSALYNLDTMTNLVCLLFVFRAHEPYYLFLFGGLHRWLMSKLM